jgi:hypothetical protein
MVKYRPLRDGVSFALCPILLRPDSLMIKLRELSEKLMSGDMLPDRYRLHVLAAITALSHHELRALARLILRRDESTDTM